MIQFSNQTFYNRHNNEISKYVKNDSSLHLININSKDKMNYKQGKKYFVDHKEANLIDLLNQNEKYDSIVLTDIVENHDDLYSLLRDLKLILRNDGKIIISSLNTKYLFFIKILEYLKLKHSNGSSSYIHLKNIKNITNGVGLDYCKFYTKQLFPFKLLGFGNLINKLLELLFFKFNFGIKTYMIFRPSEVLENEYSKSIIIPAKNEEGNLEELVSRIPNFKDTEVIFAYGKSKDNTLEVMKRIIETNNKFKFKLIEQTKTGKANAVWEAIKVVENDVIAILDADISVEPETLGDFFEIVDKNRADFVNGTRLIYHMDKNSMRFLNRLGNRFFQFFISIIINEPLSDSLCGTKVFKKSYLDDLNKWQNEFGKTDPFGDFDLIFAAAYSAQKIVELPINYKERRYGTTQISRFKDGFKLLIYLVASFIAFNTSKDFDN